MIWGWILAHWKPVAGGLVIAGLIISAGALVSSWELRGAKIERLETRLQTEQLRHQQDRAACAEISAQLREQQAAIETWRTKYADANRRLTTALRRADERIADARAEADAAGLRAVQAIHHAEGCEAKVQALGDALREMTK